MSSFVQHFGRKRDEMLGRFRAHVAVEGELKFWTFSEMDTYAREVYEAVGLDAYGFSVCEQAYLDIVRFLVENDRKDVASSFVQEFSNRGYANTSEAQQIIVSG